MRHKVKMTDCPNCGANIAATAPTCPFCGADLSSKKMPWRTIGAALIVLTIIALGIGCRIAFG